MIVENIVKRASDVGVSVSYLCGIAGINKSTFHRWKQEPPKTLQAVEEITKELDRLEKLKQPETDN